MKERKYNNIIDYIDWRGDLSFDADPFNEIDAAIFARFSYIDLKSIVLYSDKKITLESAYKKYIKKTDRNVYQDLDLELFKKMSESVRYKGLLLSFHIERNNEVKVEQFSAITISFKDDLHFISYRGTDSTINGWKEDLLMTFEESVSSQKAAIKYLRRVSEKLKGHFYIGGHSKGGNLASYATLMSEETLTNRIIGAYSFDGPGLHLKLLESNINRQAYNSIFTYIPQSSIIGRMLKHEGKILMVHSNATGLFQHDLYSWTLTQKSFDIAKDNTALSRVFETTFQDYLSNLSKEDRKKVVDVIFDAIDKCDAKTIEELAKGSMFKLVKVINHLNKLNKDEQVLISEALKVLGSSFMGGLSDEIKNYIPFIDKNR